MGSVVAVACRRSEQDEDNNNKWEQEQEVEDHWTTSSRPMVSL